ncbi:uncharacterized protein BDZ99DRAFT_413204 [Mytilinidion resinicola]|uniref:Xylanolytic transcriptional activator regulatory domain-containing protein n=1 Tax=Mytilinidion resinicola TaxID=574789 RepID=A0A6A6YU30_9PEZI|nr:uncharacterized protein BDZ99DRAFT_413204 [Mytilinidion resinicola]KAF2812466.1 hypothetical protein BDZ99DRAFT_413204 [Mytilinidion resinicola]
MPGSVGGLTPTRNQSVNNVNDRIRRLERLVTSLAETQPLARSGDVTGLEGNTSGSARRPSDVGGRAVEDGIANPSPQLTAKGPETRFVDSSHWEAILEDIHSIKQELDTSRSSEDWDNTDTSPEETHGLELLFGDHRTITIEELLCSLPTKAVADNLIHIFTQEMDLQGSQLMHVPTLLKEHEDFWKNPSAVSLAWLARMYAIMCLSLQWAMRTNIHVDDILLPETTIRIYRTRASQCLIASDYGKPTTYTLEAMVMYVACEHFWNLDGYFRASLVFAMIVRLALRAGYHRDPSHYPDISIFDGEIRRRTWAYIFQIDVWFSHKCALPRQIDERQVDTAPPVSVLDEDLYPSMVELPTPRPSNEPTSIGFLNYKTKLLEIVTRITDRSSAASLSFDDVLALDQALDARLDSRPAWIVVPGSDTTLAPIALGRLIEVDVLAQCARIILHRKYLIPARTNPKYAHSRQACLSAASQVLRHQQRLYEVSYKHYGTVTANWRALSLMSHDLLLAAMVLCMDMDQELQHRADSRTLQQSKDEEEGLTERFELLQGSHRIYTSMLSYTSDASKAGDVLGIMLNRLRRSRELSTTANNTLPVRSQSQYQPPSQSQSQYNAASSNCHNPTAQPYNMGETPIVGSYLPVHSVYPFADAMPADLVGGYGATSHGDGAGDNFALTNFLESWDWTQWDSGFASSMTGMD